ncbi:type 2 isopentenyl-diphosphate Delta-isomerase [Furfurilactobacillus siliginis]|uniref:Isopentenyl-diphosphate delta-isomerase n=1 Tax=Furfurilactobacillus siliginis TaxID=348151 RepID=A0A0R2L681_9LACO|nr:type 2 isopentenyl-diphosphate Delta-isomerase [Furfurilactobacillus siliginis]KRN96945.1 isopentenyl pyrophosphate isomerase [Furfurilactobacillus siliginis]GEK27704.1 isopentenyl-diphosphate delta-isomerase [Furfurilactobacillus siliginis]
MAKSTESAHAHRKDEHLALAQTTYEAASASDFDQVQIIHQGLPELAATDVNISTNFGALSMATPFYVEAMTGGSSRTGSLNQQLAEVAATTGLAMAVGSQSIALREPASVASFTAVRKANKTGLIFANLGAGHSLADAQRVVDMMEADALELHINTAQEIVMPEGDTDFYWLKNIETIVAHLSVPVIVKEVGFGMSQETADKLQSVGVDYINVSGCGGTNFARIENERRHLQERSYLTGWGQSTVQSLLEVQKSPLHIFASGGVRNPLDVFKALILGADAVGVAGYFLHVLMTDGQQALQDEIITWQTALRDLYLLTGTKDQHSLHDVARVLSPALLAYQTQRGL